MLGENCNVFAKRSKEKLGTQNFDRFKIHIRKEGTLGIKG